MTINLKTKQTKEELYKLLAESNLPIINLIYIIEDTHRDLLDAYNKSIAQEEAEIAASQQPQASIEEEMTEITVEE